MKDPLQPGSSPYELLGLSPGAAVGVIDAAFGAAMARAPSQLTKLSAARVTLRNPVERAIVDAFLYAPAALSRLSPDASANPAVLTGAARDETERAWRALLLNRFPDLDTLRSLCVCWYWTAKTTDGGDRRAMGHWQRAASGWAALLSMDTAWSHVADADRDAVVTRIADRLRNDLREVGHARAAAGDAAGAASFRSCTSDFDAELKAARQVFAIRYPLPKGPLVGGPQFLELLGMLDDINRGLHAAAGRRLADDGSERLREALSPLARAERLIEGGHPDLAVERIDALPSGARNSPAARRIMARAKHVIGQRLAEAGRPLEALAAWGTALAESGPDLGAGIRRDVVTACMEATSAWQATRRDEAIELLERGLALTADTRLMRALGELFTIRANGRLDAALANVDLRVSGPPPSAQGPLEQALADFERAGHLGSPKADENIRFTRGLVTLGVWQRRPSGTVEFNALPAAVRRRVADVLSGRGDPEPLVREPRGPSSPAVPAIVSALAGLLLLAVMAAGCGVGGGLSYQGLEYLVVYALLLTVIAIFAADTVYTRQVADLVPYPAGRFLFGLSSIEAEQGTLRIRCLDKAEMEVVHHHSKGLYVHSVITHKFPDGTTEAFTVGPRSEADGVLKALADARAIRRDAVAGGPSEPLFRLDPLTDQP